MEIFCFLIALLQLETTRGSPRKERSAAQERFAAQGTALSSPSRDTGSCSFTCTSRYGARRT